METEAGDRPESVSVQELAPIMVIGHSSLHFILRIRLDNISPGTCCEHFWNQNTCLLVRYSWLRYEFIKET